MMFVCLLYSIRISKLPFLLLHYRSQLSRFFCSLTPLVGFIFLQPYIISFVLNESLVFDKIN